jgi:hypothetical protein
VAQNRTGLDSCKGGPQVWTVAKEGRTHKGLHYNNVLKGPHHNSPQGELHHNSPQREPHHTSSQGEPQQHQSSRGAAAQQSTRGACSNNSSLKGSCSNHNRSSKGAAATTVNTPTADGRRAAAKREDPLTLEAQEHTIKV